MLLVLYYFTVSTIISVMDMAVNNSFTFMLGNQTQIS